ncbi:HlyIII-domain-containing protein [Daldinia decipiens]|uniref:HlyIII-domain-containing protein n=1 Tax=Daldinia decipiens TaxID=326647 RepID=UPI0020C2806B|nr:HlyIII-domain-containing protein [Daldinia decipiens]KAI1660414.1 HlyIII-domain-containing protein [Daldinia decipiens]
MPPLSEEVNNASNWSATASSDEKQQPNFDGADVSTRSSQSETRQDKHSHPLALYEEIPDWYQDNPYIRRGYRPVSNSARVCFGSWLYLHNETVNIFTHLVPAIALFISGLAYLVSRLQHRNSNDAGVVAILLLSATACLGLSCAYHTLMCHSREVEALWLRLDFVGIILLILGSLISGVYVGFWCETLERNIYWSMASNSHSQFTSLIIPLAVPRSTKPSKHHIGSLAAISIIIVLAPTFQGPKWRTLRLLTFVCTGFSGLAPIIHGIVMFGFAQMMKQSGLPYYLAEGGLFLIGAIVYATRFPESISPGLFDIYGSSHQIFHVLVVLATGVHLAGVLDALDYNYYNRQCLG